MDDSERRVCAVLSVPRGGPRNVRGTTPRPPQVDDVLAARVERLIEQHPTYGYRQLWALLRFGQGRCLNRKAVAPANPRPRARPPQPRRPEQRALGDGRHAHRLRADGWAHLAAVIDCHDRELLGYELSLRARAREAERALENTCIARFGTLRPTGATPVVRSDNSLIFQSRRGPPERRQSRAIDAALVEVVRTIIDANPTYGLRGSVRARGSWPRARRPALRS